MNKNYFLTAIMLSSIACSQVAYAHGTGGPGKSYTFDKDNNQVDREAEKKAAEKKHDEDTWADFMKSANTPNNEDSSEEDHAHDGGH
jgi:hypothetical protein